jgi:hypothetical protein
MARGVEVVAERDDTEDGLDDESTARAMGEPAPRDRRNPVRGAAEAW